jgi:hypothetical protein
MSALDALSALDEMGVPVEELASYAATEGREFSKSFTVRTQRRMEELLELKGQLQLRRVEKL